MPVNHILRSNFILTLQRQVLSSNWLNMSTSSGIFFPVLVNLHNKKLKKNLMGKNNLYDCGKFPVFQAKQSCHNN